MFYSALANHDVDKAKRLTSVFSVEIVLSSEFTLGFPLFVG